MKEPKISIIVPVYNADKFLHQCLDSILAQTFNDFEVLLIDDGSKDKSGETCDEYAAKDSRVRVFHKENGGVSSARNIGLENVRGEWVYFPDSDDVLFPNALEVLLAGVERSCMMTIAGYEVYNDDGELTYSIDDRDEGVMSREDALFQMFQSSPYRYQGYLWNKLFRNDIFFDNQIRFDESIIYNEDRLFCVKYLSVLTADAKVAFNWSPVYRYVERQYGAMSYLKQRFTPGFITDLIAFEQMGKLLRATGVSQAVLQAHKSAMCYSHNWLNSMMKEFSIHDLRLRIENEKILYKGIGNFYYVEFYMAKLYGKIKRIIK